MDKLKAGRTNSETNDLYFELFQNSPVSIWIEDWSDIKLFFDNLKKKGIKDFKQFIKTHPDESLFLAQKVKIIDVNNATLKIYDAESKEDLVDGLRSVFNKESFNVFRDELCALFEGKTEFQSETVTLTLKGEERHIILKLIVAPDHENTLSKVLVNIIDISDIKREMVELREAEEKYRKIFENAQHAILLTDMETGITLEANNQAEDLIGKSIEEIVGLHFSEFYPEEEKEYFRKFIQKRFEENMFFQNIVFSHARGKKVPVAVSGKVIELKGKKIISWILQEIKREEIDRKYSFIHPEIKDLTSREREIFMLIAYGFTNKQIANRLYISEKTIETHRANIMHKLDIHRESELVRRAISMGILNGRDLQ